MFGLCRRSSPRLLTDAIRQAIEKDGRTPEIGTPSQLRMVESSGRYSNRKVVYFRVFEPGSAALRRLEIRRYKDFDAFPALVLRSGHVEREGTVVLTRPVAVQSDTAVRTRAGRLVPNIDGSAATSPTVEAAGTWHEGAQTSIR